MMNEQKTITNKYSLMVFFYLSPLRCFKDRFDLSIIKIPRLGICINDLTLITIIIANFRKIVNFFVIIFLFHKKSKVNYCAYININNLTINWIFLKF